MEEIIKRFRNLTDVQVRRQARVMEEITPDKQVEEPEEIICDTVRSTEAHIGNPENTNTSVD